MSATKRAPRKGSVLAIPHSGPMPWVARIVLRRTGLDGRRLLLPGLGGDQELMRVELKPEIVAQLGGPRGIAPALEADRRRFAKGAILKGYGEGWAVEVDVERGYRRTMWPVTPAAPAVPEVL